jgi:aminoglycoside phosphotransferase
VFGNADVAFPDNPSETAARTQADSVSPKKAGQVGLVDCSHCGIADRYVDLALLVGELEDRLGSQARNAFTDAYGDLWWDKSKAELLF